jgi:hypothetical protein
MGYMVDNFLANAKECVKWKKSSLDEGGVGLKDRTSVWGSKKKKKWYNNFTIDRQ